jgi:nicotinamidase-related amidase
MIEIPAEPFPFQLDPDHVALIVIDMQRDFIEKGGFGDTLGNDLAPVAAIVPTVAELIALFRKKGWPILHTRETHKADLSDCPPAKRLRGNPSLRIGDPGPMGRILIRGEPGSGIVAECAPIEGEMVVDKPGKGMFYATEVGDLLKARGIKQLVFSGVTTEVCVQTSMREANDRGYENLLIEDATASYFPSFKAAAMDMIRAQGAIVGWTTPLEKLAKALP